MKRKFLALWFFVALVCIHVLSGCANNKPVSHRDDLNPVEHVGQVPDAFKSIIENNLFCGITAFDGRLLKSETCSQDEENRTVLHRVQMMDLYGNDLATYTFTSDDAYHISTLTATDDGGFLFVLGFLDYAYDQTTWASENGYASRIIKLDKDGKLQFDKALDSVDGSSLCFCFEKDGYFYFFGTIETPETKTQGVYSRTDIYMTVLDETGAVLNTRCIAGTDYDRLDAAEISDGAFLLSIGSQSDDGDFAGSDSGGYSVDWVIAVNDDLEITEKKKESGRSSIDSRIGEKDGFPVYKSDPLLNGFDAGAVTALIDYGDSYLVVSENPTGIYENTPPVINSIWQYKETVYSLYDDSGKLIFRSSVDSTPDYDAIVKALS